jgi:hypothetical protein
MGRCLIVGNQTLGSTALERAVRNRIDRGTSDFYVLTPMTRLEHEASEWTGGFLEGEGGSFLVGESRALLEQYELTREAARARAGTRLTAMLAFIRGAGGDADGELGPPDPLEAARKVIAEQPPFDEVIVSHLPRDQSRWLALDLAGSLDRLVDAPVTSITADD